MNCSENYLLRVSLHQALQKMQLFARVHTPLLSRFKIPMACAPQANVMITPGLR
jgi:hypothetical protein